MFKFIFEDYFLGHLYPILYMLSNGKMVCPLLFLILPFNFCLIIGIFFVDDFFFN